MVFFFSDPAASHCAVTEQAMASAAVTKGANVANGGNRGGGKKKSRRRRSSAGELAGMLISDTSVPTIFENENAVAEGVAAPLEKSEARRQGRRHSSITSTEGAVANNRRRSSLMSAMSESMNGTSFFNLGASQNTNDDSMNNMSMQEHLEGMESFVRLVRDSEPSRRDQFLQMARESTRL